VWLRQTGHGTLLTLVGLFLILKESEYERKAARRELGEFLGMAFAGRYLLTAMGACAIYAGIMYNDCFSIPINLYGSIWTFPPVDKNNPSAFNEAFRSSGSTYPVGLDPAWYGAKNELIFFNSFKMKLAVTIGVLHVSQQSSARGSGPTGGECPIDRCMACARACVRVCVCVACADDFRAGSAAV
jgi:V-type H+-transporting ATPase subunit a